MIGCEVGFRIEQAVEDIAVEQFSFQNDGANLLRIANVLQWIGVEQDEIGALAGRDRPLRIGPPKKFRWPECCRPQSLCWR